MILCFQPFSATSQYIPLDIKEIKRQINEAKYDTTKIRLYSILGWELRFTDHKESERLANEILKLANKDQDQTRIAEAYQIKGFARVIEQNLKEALAQYAIAIDFAKKAKNGYVEAHLLSLIAGMYQDKGDYDMAIKYYLDGLKVAEDSKSPEMIATLSNNLAEAYSDAGRPISLTLPYYLKALKEETVMGNWQYIGMIYSNIAKEQMLAGNQEEAEKAVKLSIEFIKRKSDRAYVYGSVAADIGEVYLGLGAFDDAAYYLKEAFRVLDSIGTKDNKLIPLSTLARLYLKKNDLEIANKYAQTLLDLSKKYYSKLYLRDAYLVLSEIAKKKNEPSKALELYTLYKSWNDSIFNENKEKAISNTESRLQLQEKDLELKYETEKRNKENLELKQSNRGLQNRSLIILLGTGLLLLIGIGLFTTNRKMKMKNEELEKQKGIIEKQSLEKDTLIREINHRVKNNLQIISSLLNLQANSLKDTQAIDALRESHKRVKAISLIHQKLYGTEDFASISLDEYIHSLFSELKTVYDAKNVSLICKVEPNDMLLDMESAVPIGLILNETITNALKYAFIGKESGEILISFKENHDLSCLLSVNDNGIGIPTDFDYKNSTSLGIRIISELSRQLRGKFQYYSDNGTHFTLSFPGITSRKTMS